MHATYVLILLYVIVDEVGKHSSNISSIKAKLTNLQLDSEMKYELDM